MSTRPPLKTVSSNPKQNTNNKTSGKRKSTGDIQTEKPSKARRTTLHAFFAPKVQVAPSPKPDSNVGRTGVMLNSEQNEVLKMVLEGKNVFFTGSAGTGKSLLLRAIISALRKKYAKQSGAVSVTASTGMAASNIGGMTIHAWGAVSPTSHNLDVLIPSIKTCKPAFQRWKATKVLVIDEVSMVEGRFFDTLAALASKLRKPTDKPFGGIQLVVTGDFFQLPPVSKGDPIFAFESEAWKSSIEETVSLKQVYRQKDTKFVDLLNSMRLGITTPDALNTFRSLSRPLPPSSILPTELFPMRHEVDSANHNRLKSLPGAPYTFISRDSGSASAETRAKLLKNMIAVERLDVKEAAQVMLIKNVDNGVEGGLVNGSVGVLRGFYKLSDVQSELPSSDIRGSGTAEKNGHVRSVRIGSDGKPVVVVKNEEEKENKKGDDEKDRKDVKPKSRGKSKQEEKDEDMYPLVEFDTALGKETVLLVRDEFRVEDGDGNVLARRMQVPLILAWAMSIHKSQGQTIQRVKVDLGKVFEKGQSYVALSRAASLEGLQVLRFDPTKVAAHPKVVKWYKTIEGTEAEARTSTSAPSVNRIIIAKLSS